MTDSRRRKGFIAIANEIWDEVIRRDFSKRQKDILLLIWRLSYGCNQQIAVIPMQKDFALCGVGTGHIGQELKHLETCKVISRKGSEYSFNENYDAWQVTPNRGWDKSRFNELLHLNLSQSKPETEVTKTGTGQVDEAHEESYQNGNSELPKQEPEHEGKSLVQSYQNGNFNEDSKLPKRELCGDDQKQVKVTEKVIVTPLEPLQDAASGLSKDSKDLKSLKDIKDMCVLDFDTFWSTYPKKTAKKAALNMWEKAIKAKVDASLLVQCSENYAAHCKMNRTEESFIMHGSTFLNPKNERYADFTEPPVQATNVPTGSNQTKDKFSQNKDLLLSLMQEGRHDQNGNSRIDVTDYYSLPTGTTE